MDTTLSTKSCLKCGTETNNPKFCSRSCSASYNNTIAPKRERKIWVFNCSVCDKPQKKKASSGMCATCYREQLDDIAGEMTLGESIKMYGNPRSRYNTVRHHGRKLSSLYDKCQVCGYTNILEVCHITPISAFPMETKIKEINSPDNIAILCRNHHGELDRGIMTPEQIPPRM